MIYDILKTNKFVALTFTINGDKVLICGSVRTDRGKIEQPVSMLADPEEADGAIEKILQGWMPKEEGDKPEENKPDKPDKPDRQDGQKAEEPKAEPVKEEETDSVPPWQWETDLNGPATLTRAEEESEEDEWE